MLNKNISTRERFIFFHHLYLMSYIFSLIFFEILRINDRFEIFAITFFKAQVYDFRVTNLR